MIQVKIWDLLTDVPKTKKIPKNVWKNSEHIFQKFLIFLNVATQSYKLIIIFDYTLIFI